MRNIVMTSSSTMLALIGVFLLLLIGDAADIITTKTSTSTTTKRPTSTTTSRPTSTTTTRPTSTTTRTSTKTSTSSTSTTTSRPTSTSTTIRTSTTSTTTTPSYSRATVSETSNTQIANITQLSIVSTKSNSINYDLALALGVGIGGGLLLVVIVWLALFTTWTCIKFRETKYSLLDLQKRTAENHKRTVSNSYDNSTFTNDATETTERQGEDTPYEVLGGLQTNQQFYQRMSGEDQCSVVGGYRNTIYANTGQGNK